MDNSRTKTPASEWTRRRAPSPAEACSELGFEHERSPRRRARMGELHGLERVLLQHPTATTVVLLLLLGLAYFATGN